MKQYYSEPGNGRKCYRCGVSLISDGFYFPNEIGIFHLSCLFAEPEVTSTRKKRRKNRRKITPIESRRETLVSLRLTPEEKQRITLVANALGKTSPRWGTNFSAAVKYLVRYALNHLEPNEGDPDATRRLPEEEEVRQEQGFHVSTEGPFRSTPASSR